jgi:hypothetical protein
MARIRYLKPEFFTDEDLADLQPITRIAFAGLWCYADKAGRMEDRPKYLKAMIFPYDNVDIEKQLTILATPKQNGRPFIQRYCINGSRLIQILSWNKHQKPHHTEKDSVIPEAPPLEPPLKDKGNGYSVNGTLVPLDNVSITVKEPLKRGKFINVVLKEEEYVELKGKFGKEDTDRRIETLSEYMASKGKKYKSHYATILSWSRKDVIPDKKIDQNKMICRNCGKETSAIVNGICWTCKGST